MASLAAHSYSSAQELYDTIDAQFQLSNAQLVDLTKTFLDEFKQGLEGYGHAMAMIPTFVTGVPNGTEKGTFLALDLGGTNLRVCEVVLNGDKTFSLRQQKYRVTEALKTGEATALFDYLADSVDAFLTTEASVDYTSPTGPGSGKHPNAIHLGLTFSFPVEQTALDSGKILTWTKGFAARNAIGNDVVKLLQDAFDRKHMHVKCVALVNDTVGALLSRAYQSGGCILGAIFGTGTNGAYVEEVSKIKKLAGSPAAAKGGLMVVNTEWGAFNNSRSQLPSTPFDNSLDRLSINPSFQAFEKFISGMYLGEITRNLIIAFIDAAPKPLLFNGKSTPAVNKHYGIDTSFLSTVEEAWLGTDACPGYIKPPFAELNSGSLATNIKTRLEVIRRAIVKDLGYKLDQVSLKDAAIIRWICGLVGRRAAQLSGVAVATVLIQTGRAVLPGVSHKGLKDPNEKILVGVDGSLVEHYPGFEQTLRESLRYLVGEDIEGRTDIGLAKDGSGVGAALGALEALKQKS
ncbi:hexokinase [Macrolepiota fuliginosa MF-IS2]|uniref:Phosphotransferase n=1 Tax=Macrolepiota fuliginosa MF-IS2 TaxID=1400762 RepID=A0A9P6C540_9AGAR|nr:hexokinase [Macrolepiota fuliginosa MF-IS2]